MRHLTLIAILGCFISEVCAQEAPPSFASVKQGTLIQVSWPLSENEPKIDPESLEVSKSDAEKMLIQARAHKHTQEFTLVAPVILDQLVFRKVETIQNPSWVAETTVNGGKSTSSINYTPIRIGTSLEIALAPRPDPDGAVPGVTSLSLRRVTGETKIMGVACKTFAAIEFNPAINVHPGHVIVIRASDSENMAYLLVVEFR